MQQSLHKSFAIIQAVAAGLLLGPFMLSSGHNGRWPVLALALASMALIFATQRRRPKDFSACWLTTCACALLATGWLLNLDKALLLSGVIFFCAALMSAFTIPKPAAFAATICTCLMVPLPAPVETTLAAGLAQFEASLFVILGQATGMPLRLSGAQVFFDQSVVTINQDCSGTLLLVPALLGAMTAAALAKSKTAAFAAIALAAPVALLINLVRIGVVLLLIAHGNFAAADAWHDGLGFIALTVSWALPVLTVTDLGTIKFSKPAIIKLFPATAVLITAGLATEVVEPIKTPATFELIQFPTYINGWVAEEIAIPTQELKILDADGVGRRRFTAGQREFIVTAIQHLNPRVGREHSSERCFKAMGWQVEVLSKQPVANNGSLTRLVTKSGGHSQSVLELEFINSPATKSFIRIQLVADPSTPFEEQTAFLNAFAANSLGDTL